ncbi:MAG: hypothetical protein LAT56_17835, partial [Wenzhouxiangella sp.]|nr:hypothetical protein [Wenzhouxiangella sp.]
MIDNQTTYRDTMKMKAMRIFGVLAGVAMLAACGGGSSSGGIGGDGGRASLTITASSAQVQANPQGFSPNPNGPHTVEIQVRFRQANGGNVPDGSTVTLSSGNSAVGVVSPIDSPDATGSSAVSPTSAGIARFWFTAAAQSGTVSVNASAPNPSGGPALAASFSITVLPPDSSGPQRVEITSNQSELPANVLGLQPATNSLFSTQVNVRVLSASGSPVADGTDVTLGVDNSSRALVSPIENPLAAGASATTEVAAGAARVLLTSQANVGPVVLTASIEDDQGNVISGTSLTITILPNEQDDSRLKISGRTSLPTNTQGVPIFLGSPFIAELTVEYTGPDGQIGSVAEGEIGVAVSPVFRGAFSTLDDPSTDDV